jgi:hypothetical protein
MDFSAQYFNRAQLSSKNRKAFIFSGRLSKLLISVLLLKEPWKRFLSSIKWDKSEEKFFLALAISASLPALIGERGKEKV